MKRFVLLLVSGIIFLMGCSLGQKTVPQPNPTALILSIPTPQLTALALASQSPTLTAMAAKSDFYWNVSLIQNDVEIHDQNNTFNIIRKPFTIRIKISKPILVALNVLDTEANFIKIKAGMYAWDGCVHEVHAFCDTAMVAALKPNLLAIDKKEGLAIHSFFLTPKLGEIGSKFTITHDAVIYERYVSSLNSTPIEQFTGEKLYLLFLAKYQEGNIIKDDELKKLVINFQ